MISMTYIGMMAAFFSTASFLPQALRVIRTRQTGDLSLVMYLVLNTGVVLWLIYGIYLKDLPMIVANAVTIVFTATILFMKLRYR